MTLERIQTEDELQTVRIGIDLLSKSTNAQDLCRRVAHADFMDGFCHGVSVYLLNQRSILVEVASYGRNYDFGREEISAWDETVISKAIRSRKIASEVVGDSTIFALPIQHADVTTGVFLFLLSQKLPTPIFSDEVIAMLSSLGGLFMENKGLSLKPGSGVSTRNSDDESIAVQELTSRQIEVIKLMAGGLTNAEIAKIVLLSESTVRQETIRIFRILKCHSRGEAIVKARASGIISDTPPPPPRSCLSNENGKTPRAKALGVSGF
jgi:DNA-binding CsgD family transcriptional regulator